MSRCGSRLDATDRLLNCILKHATLEPDCLADVTRRLAAPVMAGARMQGLDGAVEEMRMWVDCCDYQ